MSRYVTSSTGYQSGSSIYIRGLISWNWPRQFRLLNSLNHTCPKRIYKFQTQKFQHILFRISLIRKNSKTKTDQPTILNLCTCVRTCTLKDALMIHYNTFHLAPGRSAQRKVNFLISQLNICFGAKKNRLIQKVLLSPQNKCFERFSLKLSLTQSSLISYRDQSEKLE